MLGKLESLHILSGSSYVADVEFGAEVAFGQGSLTANSFSFTTSTSAASAQSNDQVAANSGFAGVKNADATIADDSVLKVDTSDSGSRFTFDGPSGTLLLDDAATFAGTVAGFAAQDRIDLAHFDFSDRTTLSYFENSDHTGGTLSVTSGSHIANIAFLGGYTAASFVASSEGHGGTLIAETSHAAEHHGLSHVGWLL